jgi:hypothetical protein
VMRVARGYYARDSWHGRMLVYYPMTGNINIGECPYLFQATLRSG